MGQSFVRPKHPSLLYNPSLSCLCDSSQVDCEAFKACQVGCSMLNLNSDHTPIMDVQGCHFLFFQVKNFFFVLRAPSNIRNRNCPLHEHGASEAGGQLHWKCHLLASTRTSTASLGKTPSRSSASIATYSEYIRYINHIFNMCNRSEKK